jgi:hypothetical protein
MIWLTGRRDRQRSVADTQGAELRTGHRIMALFFDHPPAGARDLFSAGETMSARLRQRPVQRGAMPDHACIRLVGGWLAGLVALLALVFAIRWYL